MIRDLVETIRSTAECEVLPSAGLPVIADRHQLPGDVEEFYRLCGGIRFFIKSPYSMEIVSPAGFVLANPVILGQLYKEDISSDWYIVARAGPEQLVTIDLNINRLGRCYDSFHEVHAVAGSCAVVAVSLTDLVERIFKNQGQYWYWLTDSFLPMGDAYG